MQHLAPAIARLRAFTNNRKDGDVIDQKSGFSVADAREILSDLDGRYTPAAPDAGFGINGE